MKRALKIGLRLVAVGMLTIAISGIMEAIGLTQSWAQQYVHPQPTPAPTATPLDAAALVATPRNAAALVAPAGPVHNTTVFGDLAHLVYTATGPLHADFVFPSDGYASRAIAVRFVVSTVRNAGVELTVGGVVVPATKLGQRVVDDKTGLTQYTYYGVILKPGPNTVTITPLGLGGRRGPSKSAVIFGPGPPNAITAALSAPLVADGRTTANLLLTAVDRWGNPADPGSVVRVSMLDGTAQFLGVGTAATPSPLGSPVPGPAPTDSGAAAATYQAPLAAGGTLAIPILPGLTPGPLRLRIVSGRVDETVTFYVGAYLRRPFVTGLASIGAGAVPDQLNGDGEYDNGSAARNRLALYASGAISKNAALTVAYESQNVLSPLSSFGPFVNDPNERPYLTYGDSSTTSSDAHSADHLYARLDAGKDSFTWGQFSADTGDQNAVGTFHALVSGAKADVSIGAQGQGHLALFTARNNVAFASSAIPASGLSTLAQPLHPNIVVGSDYLTLVALSRVTGAVVSQTPLIRNVDYTIDYATGVLRFINVPLPFDAQFDPQVVLVQYQYFGVGAQSQTTGARFDYALGRGGATQMTLGYLNDATGTENFSLFQQTLSGKLSGGGWSLSHATSNGIAPTSFGGIPQAGNHGNAYQFALDQRTGDNTLALNYQATGAGYADPFGGLSVPGFNGYRVAWTHAAAHGGQLGVEVDGQSNSGFGSNSSQSSAKATWRQSIGQRFSYNLGLGRVAQHFGSAPTPLPSSSLPPLAPPGASPSPAVRALASAAPLASPSPAPVPSDAVLPPTGTSSGSVMQAEVGAQYKATSRVTLSIDRTQNLGNNSFTSTTQPAETVGEIAYDLGGSRGKLFLRELLADTPVSSFAQSTSGLTLAPIGTRTTEFGIEDALSPATTVNSEYVIDGVGNGTDIYSALGATEKFRLGPNLGGNLLLQSANASGPGAAGFLVYGGTLTYGTGDLKAALAVQARTGLGGGMTLNGGVAGHLSDDLSLVGALSETSAAGTFFADNRISLAYRPSDNDRFVGLFGWNQTSGSGSATGSTGDVLSAEGLYRLTDNTELAGRYAFKLSGDGYYRAHTSLVGLRVRQNVGPRFDVGGEIDRIEAAGIGGAASSAFATELGYQVGNSGRAAIGYNFTGGVNPALVGNPEHRGIYVTFTTLIDRIFAWGRQ